MGNNRGVGLPRQQSKTLKHRSASPLLALLFLTSCFEVKSGRNIENSEVFFGCYDYNGSPVFTIAREKIANTSGDVNQIISFRTIKNEDYVFTKRSISVSANNKVEFSSQELKSMYKIESHGDDVLFILYGGNGGLFKFKRRGLTC